MSSKDHEAPEEIPEPASFKTLDEMRRRAEELVHCFLYGTDDAPAFAIAHFADYKTPHSIALAAQVYAIMDPSRSDSFQAVLSDVAFGTYRSARSVLSDKPSDLFGRPVDREAYHAIDVARAKPG